MTTHTLRITWPILDDSMFDREAIGLAWDEWPVLSERECWRRNVRIAGTPTIRVVELTPEQERYLHAARAVVCEAPAELLQTTPQERSAA